MKLTKCDGAGCGIKEPVGTPKSQRKLRTVKLVVIDDERENIPEGRRTFEADLCPTCEGQLLYTYFNVPADGKLELPAFAEPGSIRVVS